MTHRLLDPEPPVPQFPPGSLCAICTRPAIGALHREPLGRNDALVNVCAACATETPVERDHLFGGSARPGTGIGAGNHRTGNGTRR